MRPATPRDAREVMRRLEAEGYRPILVGGLAIELAGFGGTKDVDLLVPEAEYDGAEYLKGAGIEVLSTTGHFTNGYLTLATGRKVMWDVINPTLFGGQAFYDYVERAGSRRRSVGRVAHPSVVYYTRLLVGGTHGRRYILRIRRDLDEGAPLSWVRAALRVAHQFGTEDQVRPKVEELVRYAKSMPPRRPTRRR